MNLSNLQGRDSQLLGGLLEGDQELLALFNCSFSTQQQQPSYGQIPVECTNDHNIPRTQGLCPAASVNGLVIGKKRKRTEEKDGKQPAEGVILVRAKRGQATDSHSLAEKARRERINDRLRRLQDLVPGCYKTMGMAMMLEVITNYVRSLQNQIEFLSMKLSAATMYSTDVVNTERGIMENNEGGWLGNIWT